MKTWIILLLMLPGIGAAGDLRFLWGSYNGRYFYPRTRLEYQSSAWRIAPGHHWLELEMGGTFGFRFTDWFELSGGVEYILQIREESAIFLRGGIFWNANRLTGTDSVQPAAGVGWQIRMHPRHFFSMPLMLRFYADGLESSLSLQYQFRVFRGAFYYLKVQTYLLSRYDFSTAEPGLNSFTGIGIHF